MSAGTVVVDLRPRRGFAAAHLRGALNIELAANLSTYFGWLIPFTAPFVFVSQRFDQVVEGRRLLAAIGRELPVGWAPADFVASLPAGQRGHYEVASFYDLGQRYAAGKPPRLLDVRFPHEWQKGHIGGAQHVPLPEVASVIPTLSAREEILGPLRGGLSCCHCRVNVVRCRPPTCPRRRRPRQCCRRGSRDPDAVTWLAQAEGLNASPPSSKAGCRPLADVVGATTVVPLATGGEARYVNLDYAATAPSLARVAARVTEVLPWYSSVHRGAGYLCKVSTSLFESAREIVHDFVGARPDDLVIFTRNTTDALNLLSHAVPDGGEVVYLDVEHHANLLPWQRLANRCVPAAGTLEETFERLERALAQQPVSLLAVTGASNVTGETVPISRIVRLAHDYGTRVAVDAAQLAPHRPLDLSQLDADYVAFSGHKCYAPFGAGVLVGRRDWLDSAPAYLPGGGAVERVTIAATEWAPAPPRHEGGTPNLLGAVALAEASVVLAELGKQGAIEAHEAALRERLLIGLASLEGIRLLRILARQHRRGWHCGI